MLVTILRGKQDQISDYSLRESLEEFSDLIQAQRTLEVGVPSHHGRRQDNRDLVVFGEQLAWAWPGLRREQVLQLANDARHKGGELLPAEVWIVGQFGAVRRYAPHKGW